MLSFEQTQALGKGYSVVPISKEIFADIATPIQVLRILKNASRHCYLLESAEQQHTYGRYSFLGFDPSIEVSAREGITTVRKVTPQGKTDVETLRTNPAKVIASILEHYRSPKIEGMPGFTGGLVGYFGYDYLKYYEPSLNLQARDDEGFNDCDVMLFDKVIAFDNFRQKIMVIANASTADLSSSYPAAIAAIDEIIQLIEEGTPAPITPGTVTSDFQMLFSENEYCQMVERAKNHIREGDIFQVVLSNRIEADFEGSLLESYRLLRTINPSPYMFYFSSSDLEIAGASPETLVKLENGELHTFPLAGTRPRGATQEENARIEAELLADEKELAEHNMLVDLGRNDLGKVCRFGTVEVEQYLQLQRFSHVVHIGSTVRGEIRSDKTALDALGAVLPAGTLSGAPKLRAMQIIDDLENNKRGIYGGAIGYVAFNGDMDTAIAIRIAYKKNGKVFVRSGAGIVYDSDPHKEYVECRNKAKAVMEAISQSCNHQRDIQHNIQGDDRGTKQRNQRSEHGNDQPSKQGNVPARKGGER